MSHWPLSMAPLSWELWCLMSHYKQCCLLLWKHQQGCHQRQKAQEELQYYTIKVLIRPSAVAAAIMHASSTHIGFNSHKHTRWCCGIPLSWSSFMKSSHDEEDEKDKKEKKRKKKTTYWWMVTASRVVWASLRKLKREIRYLVQLDKYNYDLKIYCSVFFTNKLLGGAWQI